MKKKGKNIEGKKIKINCLGGSYLSVSVDLVMIPL